MHTAGLGAPIVARSGTCWVITTMT